MHSGLKRFTTTFTLFSKVFELFNTLNSHYIFILYCIDFVYTIVL